MNNDYGSNERPLSLSRRDLLRAGTGGVLGYALAKSLKKPEIRIETRPVAIDRDVALQDIENAIQHYIKKKDLANYSAQEDATDQAQMHLLMSPEGALKSGYGQLTRVVQQYPARLINEFIAEGERTTHANPDDDKSHKEAIGVLKSELQRAAELAGASRS